MTFELDQKDITIIGKALANMPYGEVVELILKLQTQIKAQDESKRTEPETVE